VRKKGSNAAKRLRVFVSKGGGGGERKSAKGSCYLAKFEN